MLDSAHARMVDKQRHIQGPVLRPTLPMGAATRGLPFIQLLTSWTCPCGKCYELGYNAPHSMLNLSEPRAETYLEFEFSSNNRPQRRDYTIGLRSTNWWGSYDQMQVDQLKIPWVIDDDFYTHLLENPLHAAAFARELRRDGGLIKLQHFAGPKPPNTNFRFVARYCGRFPTSNLMVVDQVWTLRINKAPLYPIWRIVYIYTFVCCTSILTLAVLLLKDKIDTPTSTVQGILAAAFISIGLPWIFASRFIRKNVRE